MLEAYDYFLRTKFSFVGDFEEFGSCCTYFSKNRSFMVKNFLNFGEAWKHIHTTEENRDKINITKREKILFKCRNGIFHVTLERFVIFE